MEDDPYKTPSQPTKRQKPSSPGTIIDDADAAQPDFLGTVVTACFPDQKMKVPSDPSRHPAALGDFAKIPLVHTANQIDGRFRAIPTHVGQHLTRHLKAETEGNVILLGKSGVGKTTAIFDAAKSIYCVFFSASQYKIDMQKADPGQFDISFSKMVEALKGNLDDDEECNHIIETMIVARLLLMYRFRQLPGATPLKWMQYQLTEEMHDATVGAFRLLEPLQRKTKVKVLRETLLRVFKGEKCPWFLAYDECQYGYKILPGTWKSTTTSETRGVSCHFLRIVGNLGRGVIAGTALTVDTADSCISDAGRLGTELYTEFPAVFIEQIHSELKAMLDLTGINLEKVPLWRLEGRGRLLGGLTPVLEKVVKANPKAAKETLLKVAIEKHYDSFLDNLVQKTKQSFKLDEKGNDRLAKVPVLPSSLETLALAALWGGYISIGMENIDIDLLDIGLCSVRVEGKGANKVYILDEELGKSAILRVARLFDFSNSSFAKALQLSPETKSHAMEPVVVAELARWSEEHSGSATVREFLEALFAVLPNDLPKWIDNAIFNVKSGKKSKGKGDIAFMAGALKTDGDSRGVLLSPSTVKRPDFEACMGSDEANCSPWFFAISSKLYQKTYNDELGEDLRSSDPRKGFYHKKNGDENPQCSQLLQCWKKIVIANDEVFNRCLRLHMCLPDVKPVSQRLWVEQDNSIVAYITQENVRNIFSAGAVSILEHLKAVKRTS